MKKHLIPFAAFAAFGLFFSACQKESVDDNSSDLSLAQSSANSSDMVESAMDEAEFRMAPDQISTGCPTVTWAEERGTFPNTCTIDFGSGCTGRNGRLMTGKIIVNQSDDFYTSGAIRSVSTEALTMDGNAIEFLRTVTNLGSGEGNGLMSWSVVVEGNRIKDEDGSSSTWSANRVRTMLEGLETLEDREDDVFEITGTATGTCHNGNTFSSTITTPLVRRVACQWIESGVVSIESEGRRGNRSLDFGDGTCDDKGIVTLSNGQTREITLRRGR